MLPPRPSYPEFLWTTGLQSPWPPYDCLVSSSRACGSRAYPVYRVFPVSFAAVNRMPYSAARAAGQIRGEGSDVIQHEDVMP